MHRHLPLTCLLLLGLATLHAADTSSPESTPIGNDGEIVLPRYEITETRENTRPLPWLYGRAPGFEILSCGTASQTRRLATELQRFRIALGAIWPEAVRDTGVPVTLIICGRGDSFAPFAPYQPDGRAASQTATTRFLGDGGQAFLVIDASARTAILNDDKDTPATADEDFTGEVIVDHYQELIRVYVRHLVARSVPPPPPWLTEGLAQLIGNVKYDRMSVTFGEVGDPEVAYGVQTTDMFASRDGGEGSQQPEPGVDRGRARRDGDFTAHRNGLPMMPLDRFFAVKPDDPAALNTVAGDWADQAHAFIHLCIYGENGRFQRGFMTFVARLQTQPLTEALFTECFGMNYRKFAGHLRRYTARGWSRYVRFDLKSGRLPEPEPVHLRDATPAEIARIRGDALLLARNPDTAFLALIDAYRAGERDPALLASLGLVEARRNHLDEALTLLEAATRSHVQRPRAYTELARLRLTTATTAAGGRLTKVQLAGILRPLFAARQIRPLLPDTYALIAEAWERSATPPTKDNLAVLLEGAALFPGDSATLLRGARLHQAIGCPREAAALADLGATWATDPSLKHALLTLEASLPADARVDLARMAAPGSPNDPREKAPR